MGQEKVFEIMKKKWTYQAISDECEEERSNDGAKALCNPIEEAGEDGDISSDGQPERHGGVEVAAGDVGSHRHSDEQCKCMSHSYRHQPRWVESRVRGQLVYNK